MLYHLSKCLYLNVFFICLLRHWDMIWYHNFLSSLSAGKTQCINHFRINDSWYLVDLPGYGYELCRGLLSCSNLIVCSSYKESISDSDVNSTHMWKCEFYRSRLHNILKPYLVEEFQSNTQISNRWSFCCCSLVLKMVMSLCVHCSGDYMLLHMLIIMKLFFL